MSFDTIERDRLTSSSMHTVYMALGTNLGDRHSNLIAALQRVRIAVAIQIISSIYETQPVGYLEQPDFFNLVFCGKTQLAPQELLVYMKGIESALGRQTSFRNGPRLIDIDILLYDDLIIQQENLSIPHPRMNERAFVLAPLTEIAPDLHNPISQRTIAECLQTLATQSIKKLPPDQQIILERDL